jgi:hypothetical protein
MESGLLTDVRVRERFEIRKSQGHELFEPAGFLHISS